MDNYTHEPVLLRQCLDGLDIKPDGLYVDGTTGLGGHSEAIARQGARLICLDKDEEALCYARKRLAAFGERVRFAHGDFRRLPDILRDLGETLVDGILLDLGVSSLQLDKPERGFSHRFDAALDMRMDKQSVLTAHTIVNEWDEAGIAKILRDYGEERFASSIARAMIRARPLESTGQLSEVILSALPAKARRDTRHPARRSFQALRIAVNDELGAVEEGVRNAVGCLRTDGRLCVIAFHSLEDRIVKNLIREYGITCVCPPDFPACVCGRQPVMQALGRFLPREDELAANPRAGSAVLRIAKRL